MGSDVIARIVRDYDIYIQRNYARGYTRKDLNVSFLRDQRIKIENFGDKIKERIGKGEKLLFSFLKSFGGERDWIFRPIKNVGKRAIRALSPPGSPKDNDSDTEEEDITDDEGRVITTRSRRRTSLKGQGAVAKRKTRKRLARDVSPSPLRANSSNKRSRK